MRKAVPLLLKNNKPTSFIHNSLPVPATSKQVQTNLPLANSHHAPHPSENHTSIPRTPQPKVNTTIPLLLRDVLAQGKPPSHISYHSRHVGVTNAAQIALGAQPRPRLVKFGPRLDAPTSHVVCTHELAGDGVHDDDAPGAAAASGEGRAVGEAHVRQAGLGDDGPDVVALEVLEVRDNAHGFLDFKSIFGVSKVLCKEKNKKKKACLEFECPS